jgi:hypothetical protein
MSHKKNNDKKLSEAKGKFTICTTLKDLSNDPFIIKKVESSKKLIEKYGLPKELLND